MTKTTNQNTNGFIIRYGNYTLGYNNNKTSIVAVETDTPQVFKESSLDRVITGFMNSNNIKTLQDILILSTTEFYLGLN